MGESDIRAGGAYVEIGARTEKFQAAMKSVGTAMSNMASQFRQVGAMMAGVGAAIAAPITMAMKSFAEYGNSMANLQSSTGMAQEALAGLAFAAKANNIAFTNVSTAIKQMQIAITDGSSESEDAFKRLGVSASQLAGKTPEAQFAVLADRFNGIYDPAVKATLAARIFGRAGVDLIPILDGGSEGMRTASENARRYGLVLSNDVMKKALLTDETLNKLDAAFMGLKLSIGQASVQFLPFIEKITEAVAGAGAWIRENEGVVKSIGAIATSFAAIGAGLIALGTLVSALASPAFLVAAGIAGWAVVLAGALDAAGVTDTGFKDLFNAIRIDGTGLATWFSVFAGTIGELWERMTVGMRVTWAALTAGIRMSILDVEYGFLKMAKLGASVAKMLPDKLGGQFGALTGYAADEAMAKNRQQKEESLAGLRGVIVDSVGDYRGRSKALADYVRQALEADPDTGQKWGVDTGKLQTAFEGMGKKIWDLVEKMLGGLPKMKMPDYNPQSYTGSSGSGGGLGFWDKFKNFNAFNGFDAAVKNNILNPPNYEESVSGTFVGGYGSQMSGNARLTDLAQLQVQYQDDMRKSLQDIKKAMLGVSDSGPQMG